MHLTFIWKEKDKKMDSEDNDAEVLRHIIADNQELYVYE